VKIVDKVSTNVVQLQNLQDDTFVCVTISDNGAGINPLVKERIFDPFFTTKKAGQGTGLGLSVAYGIIKNNGGMITCESTFGEGSSFSIYLPLQPTPQSEQETETVTLGKGSENIIVVDDEQDITTMMKRMLEKRGYSVTTFNSGIDALFEIERKKNHYKILISDVSMPKINGVELAKQALKTDSNLKIILMSSFLDPTISDLISSSPNCVLLSKPLDMKDLQETIARLTK